MLKEPTTTDTANPNAVAIRMMLAQAVAQAYVYVTYHDADTQRHVRYQQLKFDIQDHVYNINDEPTEELNDEDAITYHSNAKEEWITYVHSSGTRVKLTTTPEQPHWQRTMPTTQGRYWFRKAVYQISVVEIDIVGGIPRQGQETVNQLEGKGNAWWSMPLDVPPFTEDNTDPYTIHNTTSKQVQHLKHLTPIDEYHRNIIYGATEMMLAGHYGWIYQTQYSSGTTIWKNPDTQETTKVSYD